MDRTAILAELALLRPVIEDHKAGLVTAYARRLELFQSARHGESPVLLTDLAEAAGVSPVAITKALRVARAEV